MNYIVLDLEWNQAYNTTEMRNMPFEIIEIGAVKLDGNLHEIGRFSSVVKPSVYKKMSPIITEITGINENELENEKRFPTVIKEFIEWCGSDYIMCTFGSQDLHELQMNMIYHKCNIPWKYPVQYIDIQRIFGIEYDDRCLQRSLETVSVYMGVKRQGVYHRALSDAIYTSEIMKRLNQNNFEKYMSLDYVNLPSTEAEEKEFHFGTHLETITMEYDTKEEVMNHKQLRITRCPVCMKKCRKKIRWYSDASKYICVSRCENHGLLEGIISIKKGLHGGYFGIRKVLSITDDRFKEILKRKEVIREKRRNKRHKEKEKKK